MRKKIVLSLFALLIFFSAGSVLGVLYLTNTTSELKRLIELYQVEELRRSLIISIQTVQNHLHTAHTEFAGELDAIVQNVLTMEEASAKCSSCHHPRDLSARIVQMQSLMKDYQTHLSYVLTARANTKRLSDLREDAALLGNQLVSVTEQMSHSASMSLGEKTEKAMANISDVKIILMATVLATTILGVIVAVRLTRSVTRPVKAILDTTRLIASGQYGATIAFQDRTEFGELAKHFNTMSTAVKEGYETIREEVTERRQTEEALRQSEEKFRTFFEMSPTGIMIYPVDKEPFNRRLSFATFNVAYHRFFGYTREELESKTIAEISLPEDLLKNIALSRELMEGKRSNYQMEKRYMRKDGSTVWGYISTTLLPNPGGKPGHIMTILTDITERKKIEEEHLKIQKLESLGILAGGIAHDFNNILTTIVGNITLAKMSSPHNRPGGDILADAEEACRRARDLTVQLLTFSRGGAPIKKITSIAGQLRDSARFVLRGTNVNCRLSIADDLWPVDIDEGQINQVIFNLIINASQAMHGGGTVDISAENTRVSGDGHLQLSRSDYVKITVRDQGVGIPQENLSKIFDPYFTTKQSGSGLGLASTYAIIKNHDGYIDVESEPGRGSAFYVFLPAAVGRSLVRKAGKNDILPGEGKVLLMDDDANILSTVSRTLIKIGYRVEIARDGSEAISLYQQALSSSEPFDAIIMDLTIRDGMGGREAMGEIMRIDPKAKVIVSSGYSTDTIMANYQEYGFCGVITKPYQIEALSELLQKVISQHI
ncbi:MAG: PAS domain S-box protein [Nitrospiraceae bacterium]|nr:MAG: PAS domain S-box protein [Nitrospiraceae bacterium]